MAGPSIAVRVLGDMTGLSNAFKGAGDKAGEVASKAHDAFSGMLSTINKTGVLGPFGEALGSIDESIGRVIEHGKKIGPALMGVGGALVGVGAGLQAIGSKDQAAHQQLQAAVEASGKDYEDYAGNIEKAIKGNEKYGQSADKTQDALRILTQATGDPGKALQYLGTATDLAAAKHEDLNTAATQLGKTFNGGTKLLKDFGLQAGEKAKTALAKLSVATDEASNADDAAAHAKQRLADLQARLNGQGPLSVSQQQQLRDAQAKVVETAGKAQAAHEKLGSAQADADKSAHGQSDTMSALSEKLKGQASAAADTFSGKMAAIKAKVEDAAAAFGQKYGPAITAVGAAMTGLGAIFQVAPAIFGAVSAAWDVLTTAEYASMLPYALIIAAVALVGVAVYELVTHWSEVWGTMKRIVMDVWQWIKDHWPLLVDILFGPIGLAVTQIVQHWSAIKNAFVDAFNWVRANWPLLLAILTGPIGLAVLAIQRNWDTIKGGAKAAVDWITGVWDGLVGWFGGLPGRLGGIFNGMWNGIQGAFRATINGVIDLWNRLHFTLPHIDLGPLGSIGGGDIGVPHIPYLAKGGLMTADGLIYAHAGEVISPAPPAASAGRQAPAVIIQNATFTDQADIDTFLRQAAWAVRLGGI